MGLSPDVQPMIDVHEYIYRHMQKMVPTFKGKRILDCGAGFQDKTTWMNMVGSKFFLGELFQGLSVETIDIRPQCGCTYTGDIESLSGIVKGKYDILLCFETLEHVLHPIMALDEMRNVLNDDGLLFVSVPFTQGHHTPRDLWRWTEDGLKFMMMDAKFEVVKMLALGGTVGREYSWMAVGKKSLASQDPSKLRDFDRL